MAAKLTVGNAKRDSIEDMLMFFSAFIVDGFDPAVSQQAVIAKLVAFADSESSHPALDDYVELNNFIDDSMQAAERRDNEKFGKFKSPRRHLNKHYLF